MIVERPARLNLSLPLARGLGMVAGLAVPLATATLYDQGLRKELARQTALRLDVRCAATLPGHGPWSAGCTRAVAEVAATRVAGWRRD